MITGGQFSLLEKEAERLVANVRNSVVLIESGQGSGSGIVWNREGVILTNAHVIHRGSLTIESADGKRYPAQLLGIDQRNDLAALVVQGANLPSPPLGDARSLRVGEIVIAVGNPFGIRGNATLGIVSGVGNRTWMGHAARELLQADVVLAPGNSGGPLTDSSGRVVGINSMVLSPGIAASIPVHLAQEFAHQVARRRAA
jgi:S1-C subfamily serine protease